MRISAQFYSIDDAELAAAALRRNSEGIFDIEIRENKQTEQRSDDYAPMGFYTNLSAGYSSAVPLPVNNISGRGERTNTSAELDIICRASEHKRVSSVIISSRGHHLIGR